MLLFRNFWNLEKNIFYVQLAASAYAGLMEEEGKLHLLLGIKGVEEQSAMTLAAVYTQLYFQSQNNTYKLHKNL